MRGRGLKLEDILSSILFDWLNLAFIRKEDNWVPSQEQVRLLGFACNSIVFALFRNRCGALDSACSQALRRIRWSLIDTELDQQERLVAANQIRLAVTPRARTPCVNNELGKIMEIFHELNGSSVGSVN
jgi:hypothetical protein